MRAVAGGSGSIWKSTPGTMGLVVALLVAFVIAWLPGVGESFVRATALVLPLSQPWTLVTYPLAMSGAGDALFWHLITCFWLYSMGSTLEPSLGSRGVVLAFVALALIGGLSMLLGVAVLGLGSYALAGPFLAVASLSVLWGARFQGSQVRMMGIIPITGLWIAILSAVLVFFSLGSGAPLLGLFALIAPAVAWFAGIGKLPLPGPSRPRRETKQERAEFNEFIGKVRDREKDREERERLRKLFESSVADEDER